MAAQIGGGQKGVGANRHEKIDKGTHANILSPHPGSSIGWPAIGLKSKWLELIMKSVEVFNKKGAEYNKEKAEKIISSGESYEIIGLSEREMEVLFPPRPRMCTLDNPNDSPEVRSYEPKYTIKVSKNVLDPFTDGEDQPIFNFDEIIENKYPRF